MQWTLKTYNDLSLDELYAILQLRNEVFIIEQQCPYQDLDEKDKGSWHFMGWQDGRLVAYTRLLPAGLAFDEPSIGRVVTAPSIRRTGQGRILMQKSIEHCHQLFGHTSIQIGAQRYLESFYQSLGFQISGFPYLEDGIPHIHMILR